MSDLNCKEATRLLLQGEERALSSAEVQDLDFHLSECLCCRNFRGQFRFLKQALARYAEQGPAESASGQQA